MGKVLITDLHNRCMPFIRYEIGDSAAWADSCGCARGFPSIRRIVGRTSDFAQTKEGGKVSVRVLGSILMARRGLGEWVRFYQFLQDRPGHLILRVVPDEVTPYNLDSLIELKLEELQKLVPMDFDLEFRQELEKLPSGKRALLLRRSH